MKSFIWHETKVVAPPIDKVVLGWWGQNSMHSVVRRFTCRYQPDRWHAPGYWIGEERTEPKFWAEPPDSPMLSS